MASDSVTKAKPCIGKSFEQIDETTYKIEIFDNVYDSKGNHITADDVLYSYNTGIGKGNLVTVVGTFGGIEKVDDYHVILKTNGTSIGNLESIVGEVYIVSEKEYEADPDDMANIPVGTGPYILKEFVPGSTIDLEKNPNYWQSDDLRQQWQQANVDEIIFKMITETAQLTVALQTGEVDLVPQLAQSEMAYFDGVDGYHVFSKDSSMAQVLMFNCVEGSLFSDPVLRQAICYAIDKSAVLDAAFDGIGGVCHAFGTPIYGDYLTKWDSEEYYDYNPDKAKELLSNAGYDEGEFSFRLMTDNVPYHLRMAQVIVASLNEAGIKAEILPYDSNLFGNYRYDPSQFDALITFYASGDYIINVWRYSMDANFYGGGTSNFYVDDHFQELLSAAAEASTHSEDTIDAFAQYLKETAIAEGLCYGKTHYAYNDKIDTLFIDVKESVYPGACTYTK
ncbi:MAG: ABC transporter substrate-binding protein [Anaerolineaceae bacterium]|nr:ABC transporter substrate-binding protein [Anaerolineaceae bacterium]